MEKYEERLQKIKEELPVLEEIKKIKNKRVSGTISGLEKK